MALLAIFLLLWLGIERLRLFVLLLPLITAAASRLPGGSVRLAFAVVGVVQLVLASGIALISSTLLPRDPRTVVSPDGRWEVRYQPEMRFDEDEAIGGALYLAPRGLVSRDPRAYPYRTLVDFATVTAPANLRWSGPREVSFDIVRNSDGGPILKENPHVRVIANER